jgi:hypothetical protein
MSRKPTLRIHIWGGLGSQLYGWALAELISEHSKRKIRLVFHSSGVTKRLSDLNFLKSRHAIDCRDDFAPNLAEGNKVSKKRNFMSLVKTFLKFSLIVMYDEQLERGINPKPWTVAIRGHYTRITYPDWVIKRMMRLASEAHALSPNQEVLPGTLFHYRLGDLRTLVDKNPLDSCRFISLQDLPQPFFIASDSPETAKSLLLDVFPSTKLEILESLPWQMIDRAIKSETFVGTASKLSFWIIAFRSIKHPKLTNYMPSEHVHHLGTLVKPTDYLNIQPY